MSSEEALTEESLPAGRLLGVIVLMLVLTTLLPAES
jgi:hypothetical protein